MARLRQEVCLGGALASYKKVRQKEGHVRLKFQNWRKGILKSEKALYGRVALWIHLHRMGLDRIALVRDGYRKEILRLSLNCRE